MKKGRSANDDLYDTGDNHMILIMMMVLMRMMKMVMRMMKGIKAKRRMVLWTLKVLIRLPLEKC